MSEQPGPTPLETTNASTPEKIHPNRQLWMDVLAGRGINQDGTPRRLYTDEELRGLAGKIETAAGTPDKALWQDWIRKYESGGVPIDHLLLDLNAEIQRRSFTRAAVVEAETSLAVVVAEDSVRTAEQDQPEELRRQLLEANLRIARLTEANTQLFQQNRSLGDEVKRLRPPEPAKAAQVKTKGFLDRIFGGRKESAASAAPAAKEEEKPQIVPVALARPVRWTEEMSLGELLKLREKFVEGDAIAETGRQLNIGPFLKAGLIGAVYPAIDEKGGRYAVKLPAANLSADALVRFNEEATVVEGFYKAWKRRYPNDPVPFPGVIKLTSAQYRGKAVKK